MTEYTPTYSEKLELMKEHFLYEFEMVYQAAYWQSAAINLNGQSVILANEPSLNNMFLEIAPIHARTLIQFFISDTRGRNGRDKDALVKDFLRDGEEWVMPIINATASPNLNKVQTRVNKEMVHLSYERVSEGKTSWDLKGILAEMLPIVKQFALKCKGDYESERLNKTITDSEAFFSELERLRTEQKSV